VKLRYCVEAESMSRKNKHRANFGAGLAEFAPALFVFFLFIIFPLINFIALGTGAATVYLIAKQAATKAASSTTFGKAMMAAEAASYDIESGGLGVFSKLAPIGGFNGSGLDLYITETNIATNVSTRNGPNTPFVTNPIDPSTYLYSYDAEVTFNIGPFTDMHDVPWIGGVPGLGVPARLTYTASENVEHPEGIETGLTPDEFIPDRIHPNNPNPNGGGGVTM
jgi:hypothetical protein